MTVKAKKFTPEVLLSAPRRGPAIPNHDGSLILYTVSTFSFDTHSRSSEIRVYDVEAKKESLISADVNASDPTWLGHDNHIIFLQTIDDGETALSIVDYGTEHDGERQVIVVHIFPGPISSFKVKALDDTSVAIAVAGQAKPDGSLHNPGKASRSHSTARIYDSLFVRHWDTYVTSNRNSIWYACMQRSSKGSSDYHVRSPGFVNALKDTKLESPIPPFGGTDHYDISQAGLAFVAKDPELNPATHTKSDPYFVPLTSSTERESPKPRKVRCPEGFEGASSYPVFSPDGSQLALLRMKNIAYESDQNHLLILRDASDPLCVARAVCTGGGGKKGWDRSPSSIIWTRDGVAIAMTAENHGRSQLFVKYVSGESDGGPPKHLILGMSGMPVFDMSVVDVRPVKDDKVILTLSSLVDSSVYAIVPSLRHFKSQSISTISSATNHGKMLGLKGRQIDEFWFEGATKRRAVHAWMVKPSTFDSSKTYPLAYLIHGGPQGAWLNSWSTRWNPGVFAEQGYVVICPNPTGSTGYGQEFTDAIAGEWGGLPYEDLVKGFEYIRDHLDYVDTSRAVALGASYGGYMMNWIQGQSLGREFKGLVTHDGVFSTTNQIASEELYFPHHDFKGTLWDNRREYEKWNPAWLIKAWETPHLIIHNELDYRLPISEGLAAFNALQARGVKSRFLSFPDENHWVLKPENSLVWHRVVLGWINELVGLQPSDEGTKDDLLAKEMEKVKF